MIVFENRGEIDVTAMTTFGVSVKVGENPIGFFGTGLKYAIAVLLRTGHKIDVYSGEDHMRFSTRRGNVRGKDFEFVDMSVNEGPQQPIGFTTELGKAWEPWMAYREIYCNTRDEGGEVYSAPTASALNDPRPDLTQIRIEGDGFEQVHREHALYFLEGEPDLTINGVQIFRRPSDVLFYRGIRVLKLPQPAIFTYNLTERIDLTEDRTMTHPFMATYYLAKALRQCEEPEILEAAITAASDSLEFTFDYRSSHYDTPSETFLSTVGRLANEATGVSITPSARGLWEALRTFVPVQATLDHHQQEIWQTALDFLPEELKAVPILAVDNIPDGGGSFIVNGHLYISASEITDLRPLLRLMILEGAKALAHRADVEDSPEEILALIITGLAMQAAPAKYLVAA